MNEFPFFPFSPKQFLNTDHWEKFDSGCEEKSNQRQSNHVNLLGVIFDGQTVINVEHLMTAVERGGGQ